MTPKEQIERIREISIRDGRYAPEAFLFVSKAIGQTVEWIRKKVIPANDLKDGSREEAGGMFHVSGQELLVGFRRLAQARWGLLARHVLACWGIRRTEDVGEIVFLMVEDEKLQWRKRECDRREDFAGGFAFESAFAEWFDEE